METHLQTPMDLWARSEVASCRNFCLVLSSVKCAARLIVLSAEGKSPLALPSSAIALRIEGVIRTESSGGGGANVLKPCERDQGRECA
eukprot:477668-Pyramimonas_sp.AAC.1